MKYISKGGRSKVVYSTDYMADREQIESWAFAEFTKDEISKMGDKFASLIENINNKNEQNVTQLFNEILDNIEPQKCYALCRLLIDNGFEHICKEQHDNVYGVIFQIGLEEGMATLAIYPNKKSLYINGAGNVFKLNPLTVEQDALEMNPLINELFGIAADIAQQLKAPNIGHIPIISLEDIRINFLTGKGLKFMEGNIEETRQDLTVASIFILGMEILSRIVKNAKKVK